MSAPGDPRRDLRADCARCIGLCCVASAFAASADFAITKEAGLPCPNLRRDFGCAIHDRLRQLGFPGCVGYDCFGAGQQTVQVTFGGRDQWWTPRIAAPVFAAFAVLRQLHELLWYLAEALTLAPARPVHADLRLAFGEIERLTRAGPDELARVDPVAVRESANALLLRVSELARAGFHPPGADHRGADLIGADLRRTDLAGASLRGACLVAADLRSAVLTSADFTGADLRGADLRGTDLAGSIFLTQSQLEVAKGDRGTRVPASLTRPAHWTGSTPRHRGPRRPAAARRG
ncbi:MAG: pentapeptide repeat-containing protein [Dactylosporangium sp.]|nr:pentapeptide repeat-containing protein [Dactylosporangium sp.]